MGILPVATFCSGHTFFVQRMADVLGLQPYVVHATFQFSGTPGKRHRMRESLLWDVVSHQPACVLLAHDNKGTICCWRGHCHDRAVCLH